MNDEIDVHGTFKAIGQHFETLDRLKLLCARAADALELWHTAFDSGNWTGGWMEENAKLIDELRKVAE